MLIQRAKGFLNHTTDFLTSHYHHNNDSLTRSNNLSPTFVAYLYIKEMKKIFLSISICLTIGSLLAQTSYPKEIEAQIKQVENHLFSRIILNGKEDNIVDRMAYYKVKGLSIAVVNKVN